MAEPLLLKNLSWPDIGPLRERNGGLLILPIGNTAQHGPHLPISTDSLLAERFCHEVSAKTSVPVLPTLSYGVSQGHTAKWPGTFSLTHSTLIAILNELADWAAASGWRRLLFVNVHSGNDCPALIAVDQIRIRHLGKLQIGLLNLYNLTPEIFRKYTVDSQNHHANKAETELMLHLFPEMVRRDLLTEADDFDRTIGTIFSHPASQTSFNGTTGFPSHSNAQAGAFLYEQISKALEASIKRAIGETVPLPASEWENIPDPQHPNWARDA